MLKSINLCKSYGDKHSLSNLSLEIAAGEVFCLMGANGAGKTTTINLFLGFIRPTSGVAMVNGLSVADHPQETKHYLSFIPENVTLFGELTGLENLEYFVSLMKGVSHSREALMGFLKKADLAESDAFRRVSTYSKGMRQKVALAIAFAKDAKVILMDEPTSGLDPQASNLFSDSVIKLAQRGMTVLMATHDLYRAKDCATRLGIMRQGVLREVVVASEISHSDLEKLYLKHMES